MTEGQMMANKRRAGRVSSKLAVKRGVRKPPTPLRPARGAKRRNSRRGPERDEAYRAFVRKYLCIGCYPQAWILALGGNQAFVDLLLMSFYGRPYMDAMHTGPHGVAQKASDYTCLPGCRRHHRELDHQIGKAFWKKYGLDRDKLIAFLRAEYERTKA